jgi:2-succinyl-6-hydroxy-2,4-cyclohexadiene-1-carboxylate synthase
VAGDASDRVLLVHGFTQTATSWMPVTDHLMRPANVPTLPTGNDFVAVARALDAGPATYVGYSQGGRLCLQLALDRPEVVHRLVLESATPGIADPD